MRIGNYFSKLAIFLGIIFIFSSCGTTKNVPESQMLLVKNKYKFEKKAALKSELPYYTKQKPNSKILFTVPYKLALNSAIPKELIPVYESYFRLSKKNRTQEKLDSIYKVHEQNKHIGKKHKLYRFYYRNGESPVLIDTLLSKRSAQNIQKFYHSEGYFNAQVGVKTDSISQKKAKNVFEINTKKPYEIGNYDFFIEDPNLESLFEQNMEDSYIKLGKRFRTSDVKRERNRIKELYQKNGYYQFDKKGEDISFYVDSTDVGKNKVELLLRIPPKKKRSDSISPHAFNQKYFGKVSVLNKEPEQEISNYNDSIEGIEISGFKRFNPSIFTRAIDFQKGDLYNDQKIKEAKKNILGLSNFNISRFEEVLNSNDTIDVRIELKPKKRYELELSLESAYTRNTAFDLYTISPGFSLLRRNLFGNGENLKVSLTGAIGSIGNRGDENKDEKLFNAWQFALNTSLDIPRPIFLFNIGNRIPKHYNLHSKFNLGFSNEKNIGLGTTTYSSGLEYEFTPTVNQKHTLKILDTHFISNNDKNRYFEVFSSDANIRDNVFTQYFSQNPEVKTNFESGALSEENLYSTILNDQAFENSFTNEVDQFERMLFRRNRLTEDFLINALSYQFLYSEYNNSNVDNPWYIGAKVESSGNFLWMLDRVFGFKQQQTIDGQSTSTIFNTPYSQYLKLDLDVRKNWSLGRKRSFVGRIFTGAILPFGNSETTPFQRSFYSGGSTDVRAWRAYELGPSDVSDSFGGFAVNQFKITLNAEYRFNLMGDLYSALFVDAGNIWSLNSDNPSELFKLSDFYKELGIGGGLGLRYDFKYLILRLDLATKLHDPSRASNDRWVVDKITPKDFIFNFGINYPF